MSEIYCGPDEMGLEMTAEPCRDRNRDGISDLLSDRVDGTFKGKRVGKGLKSSSFPNADRPILRRMPKTAVGKADASCG